MLYFHLKLTSSQRKALEDKYEREQRRSNIVLCLRILTILSIADGYTIEQVAKQFRVTVQTVNAWVKKYLLLGAAGLNSRRKPGRPPKLTKSQRRELAKMLKKGPAKLGFVGNCWRSPMVQQLIFQEFRVAYAPRYICQLMKNIGFSYQKARFVSDHKDPKKRKEWIEETWPSIIKISKEKEREIGEKPLVLFEDEASFAQWGSLSYTWAPVGKTPTIKTSGKRKNYKVFGAIDYHTGQFFHKCYEGRLNSESYEVFIQGILDSTKCHIILIHDGASYHKSAAINQFYNKNEERLSVFRLPSYSPDYNPIEKLWKKVKEKGTHLHYFPTFESLKSKVHQSLELFDNDAKEVLSLFLKFNNLIPEIQALEAN